MNIPPCIRERSNEIVLSIKVQIRRRNNITYRVKQGIKIQKMYLGKIFKRIK